MTTQIFWHPDIFLHDRLAGHVAMAPTRIADICQAVLSVTGVEPVLAQPAGNSQLEAIHKSKFLQMLESKTPKVAGEEFCIDLETILNVHTWRAMTLSAGAACQAIDAVLEGRATNAFCPVYAGHHAMPAQAGGFCFINSVAVAARHGLSRGLTRVAILDIDTHSGNGTITSFLKEPQILFAETYQKGYPGAFMPKVAPKHILRRLVENAFEWHSSWAELLEHVKAFKPELALVSAGFDAHHEDPLGVVELMDDDYQSIAKSIIEVSPRVVACLEGGYAGNATARCAALFVRELLEA
jgi:acetoin utilization deacetylase AcuC-like enzyme